MKRVARSSGFTLIEVLVVVAIIALLVAILIPSLQKARWQAKVSACQARLHDLGNAFQMYANTYKGYFPLTASSTNDNFCALWRGRFLPDPNVLICPATQNVVRSSTLEAAKNVSTEDRSDLFRIAENKKDSSGGHSYEYNGCYPTASDNPFDDRHKKTSSFMFPPHDLMLVHDADDEQEGPGIYPALGCRPSIGGDEGNNCPQPWDNHGETGMNMMFADGHVQWAHKTAGHVIDMSDADDGNIPAPEWSVNAEIDKIWLKSQYPWRYRR